MVRPDPFRDHPGAHEDPTRQGKSSSGKRAEPHAGHTQDPSHMSGITAWPKKGGGGGKKEKKKKPGMRHQPPLQTRAVLLALNLLLLIQGNDPPSSEAGGFVGTEQSIPSQCICRIPQSSISETNALLSRSHSKFQCTDVQCQTCLHPTQPHTGSRSPEIFTFLMAPQPPLQHFASTQPYMQPAKKTPVPVKH